MQARPWISSHVLANGRGLAASLGLHGLLLLACTLALAPRPVLQFDEGIPVEIWSPAQFDSLSSSKADRVLPSPPDDLADRETPPGQASVPTPPLAERPDPLPGGTIRATRMLSQQVLAQPLSRQMRQALSTFDEETRIEQLCGIEAMAQIVAASKQFQPDRVVAYAMADVKVLRGTVLAEGAAFRSAHQWYGLTFKCELSPDRRTVKAFEFSLGDAIPRQLWEAHNLPPIH
ncbi:DUF930 domain-containing protein [Microvirga puerhi]|uniref:DUF930 domain-containing protein n=1 Tax=Microvirga puerhi TaxID=2876078 RepID=A0ABS7VRG2_9HYPH|nr:DUF930 domain-containing protein [Microvirga puerhi]MBZ6078119.1 DUF930 domain-containing protein [Microvirga puerhi]